MKIAEEKVVAVITKKAKRNFSEDEDGDQNDGQGQNHDHELEGVLAIVIGIGLLCWDRVLDHLFAPLFDPLFGNVKDPAPPF